MIYLLYYGDIFMNRVPDSGIKNLSEELEKHLSLLVEVRDYVHISKSPTIGTLEFLKSIRTIRGENLLKDKYANINYVIP